MAMESRWGMERSELPDQEEEDSMVTLIVNGRTVTVKKGLPAKTILGIFCQQNKLQYPVYKVTVVNESEPELKLFRAKFHLDGQNVVGIGQDVKKAEMAAARKFINDNFISGENSTQAEVQVPNSNKTIPPKQVGKQIKRIKEYNKGEQEVTKAVLVLVQSADPSTLDSASNSGGI
eukprot:GFUD01140532.1.p1 GENE.GFUD01140532.1~~GFUD01140532.1.p1  ORF type:complete len:176 (+),score=44.88 GFUD01140532.1:116-643(+)